MAVEPVDNSENRHLRELLKQALDSVLFEKAYAKYEGDWGRRGELDALLIDIRQALGQPQPVPIVEPAPLSAKEKWQRLTHPQTVADYGLSMTLAELQEVPEAALIVSGIRNASRASDRSG